MHPRITLYRLGNADCSLLRTAHGRVMVNDFAATRGEESDDRRIDLHEALREDLGERSSVDVLTISHLDEDHFKGSTEFFFLEHSQEYQKGSRIRIGELWVPAGVITEKGIENAEARVIQREARYRLKQGSGIRVFSCPHSLVEWLEDQGLSLEERSDLITHAGECIPGFSIKQDGVEFFVHAPFAEASEDGKHIVRNETPLVLHATFKVSGHVTKAFFGADVGHEDLAKIVTITLKNGNRDRLEHQVVKLPHHCSYLSLGPEKGSTMTKPVPEVACFYEQFGGSGVILVSSSDPIPETESNDPPHVQAAQYYRYVVGRKDGRFIVTMEHPDRDAPDRLVIDIGQHGASISEAGRPPHPISKRAPIAATPLIGGGPPKPEINLPMNRNKPWGAGGTSGQGTVSPRVTPSKTACIEGSGQTLTGRITGRVFDEHRLATSPSTPARLSIQTRIRRSVRSGRIHLEHGLRCVSAVPNSSGSICDTSSLQSIVLNSLRTNPGPRRTPRSGSLTRTAENLIVRQARAVQRRHPLLSLMRTTEGALILDGQIGFTVPFESLTVQDEFRIRILFPADYPREPPIVFEVGSKIPRTFGHFMDAGNLCLGAPVQVRMRFAKHRNLLHFIESQVVPYLFSWSYRRDYGHMPFGELEHGDLGLLQFYGTYFGTPWWQTLRLLRYLADGKLLFRGCPCGSEIRVDRCHGPKLETLRPHLHPWFAVEFNRIVAFLSESGVHLPGGMDQVRVSSDWA